MALTWRQISAWQNIYSNLRSSPLMEGLDESFVVLLSDARSQHRSQLTIFANKVLLLLH